MRSNWARSSNNWTSMSYNISRASSMKTCTRRCHLSRRCVRSLKSEEQRARVWNQDYRSSSPCTRLNRFLIDKLQILQLQYDRRLYRVAIGVDIDYAGDTGKVFCLGQRV